MKFGLARRPVERRSKSSYTDTLVQHLLSTSQGKAAVTTDGLAALSAAAGFVGNALAAATVTADRPDYLNTIGPGLRHRIGVDLIRKGMSVAVVEVEAGAIKLIPACAWLPVGDSPDPHRWFWTCDLPTPNGALQKTYPASQVLVLHWETDHAQPWRGISPMESARTSGALAAALETRLGEEAAAVVGSLIPVPSDGGDDSDPDDPLYLMKQDIGKISGGHMLVETTAGAWGDDLRKGRSAGDWQPRRLGANPPQSVTLMRDSVQSAIWQACQIPPALFHLASDGTSQRESFRRVKGMLLEPLAARIAEAVTQAVEPLSGLRFDFSNLYAHDLVGRANAFRALTGQTGENIPIDQALEIVGLR